MPPHSRGLSIQMLNRAIIFHNSVLPYTSLQLCKRCSLPLFFGLRPLTRQRQSLLQTDHFSTSTPLPKKSSSSPKSSRHSPAVNPPKKNSHIPDNKATLNKDSEIDPYDFSELENGISQAIVRLKDNLLKTRDAGRVSTAMIEKLPVEVNVKGSGTQGGSAHKERSLIRDLASVVPKGSRMIQVYCAEEGHIKPITSAIQSSPYSLVPQQPEPERNPLLLNVPTPPATTETRAQAATEAKKVMDKASLEVRNARGDAHKRLRKMELEKLVVVDELRKAHSRMEDIVKKAQEEVKKIYDGALKALER